ncbi:MAG: hypothetical protein KAW88_03230 [Candidatus Cloacimonetes bacterium]|nr:hypothetical protein [Candidatus Cloacimonadota bacterium]
MSKIFILDAVSLINILERCESKNLMDYFKEIDIKFHVIREVVNEFNEKPKEIGKTRLQESIDTSIIEIIDFGQENVDISVLNKLHGLDEGEIESALYHMENREYKLVSDDNTVHKILLENFEIHCVWTTNLLQILINNKIIGVDEAKAIYHEMKQNGFWGIKQPVFRKRK